MAGRPDRVGVQAAFRPSPQVLHPAQIFLSGKIAASECISEENLHAIPDLSRYERA